MATLKQMGGQDLTKPISGSLAETSAVRNSYKPAHEEIAAAAYEIYLSRGAVGGRELEDWLEAEQQLLARPEISQKARSTTA